MAVEIAPRDPQFKISRMRKLISSGILVLLLCTGNAFAQRPADKSQETKTPKKAQTAAEIVQAVSDEFDAWLKQEDLRIQQQYEIPITQLPPVSLEKAKQDALRAQRMLAQLEFSDAVGNMTWRDKPTSSPLTH